MSMLCGDDADDASNSRAENATLDVSRLRYHLTNLYTLRPVPDEFLNLILEIQSRRNLR
jgi:hypothetical protein